VRARDQINPIIAEVCSATIFLGTKGPAIKSKPNQTKKKSCEPQIFFWRSLHSPLLLKFSSLHPIDDHVGDQSQCSHSFQKSTTARPSSSCPSRSQLQSDFCSLTTYPSSQEILNDVPSTIWSSTSTTGPRI